MFCFIIGKGRHLHSCKSFDNTHSFFLYGDAGNVAVEQVHNEHVASDELAERLYGGIFHRQDIEIRCSECACEV